LTNQKLRRNSFPEFIIQKIKSLTIDDLILTPMSPITVIDLDFEALTAWSLLSSSAADAIQKTKLHVK
jgi:hypothetical protein